MLSRRFLKKQQYFLRFCIFVIVIHFKDSLVEYKILDLFSLHDIFKKFFYLFLPVKGLCCCMDFSLVAESGGNTLVVICKFLIVVASLVAEHVP